MHDQAKELRQLVRQSAAATDTEVDGAPYLLAVTGGKGGVGTTTLAVNLAVALAQHGRRAMLVDLDFGSADASALCQLDGARCIVDLLEGRRTIHEVVERGPAGALVLPGPNSLDRLFDCSTQAQQRLIAELRQFGAHVDVVILDVGSGRTRLVETFCHAADATLVVTTPEPVAVLDAYAMLKVLHTSQYPGVLYPLINRVPHAEAASYVQARLAQACQRFLGQTFFEGGHLPEDDRVYDAGRRGEPFVLGSPQSPAARRLEFIAERVVPTASDRRQRRQIVHRRLDRSPATSTTQNSPERGSLIVEA